MKRIILLFSILLASFNLQAQDSTLIISCKKKAHVKKDSIQVEITYYNNTKDTLYLPAWELRLRNLQILYFDDQIDNENIGMCGADAKMSMPYSLGKCNFICMEENGFKAILPNSSITLIFKEKDISCLNGQGFKKGKEYQYGIVLHIESIFKEYNPKVWTGQVNSRKGSFIIN